jgi:hypothetical protein
MPSLEILDIGRNKIKRLPTQPGSLVNLRVWTLVCAWYTDACPYTYDLSGVLVLSKQDHQITSLPGEVHTSLHFSSGAESLGMASQEAHGDTISHERLHQDNSTLD